MHGSTGIGSVGVLGKGATPTASTRFSRSLPGRRPLSGQDAQEDRASNRADIAGLALRRNISPGRQIRLNDANSWTANIEWCDYLGVERDPHLILSRLL